MSGPEDFDINRDGFDGLDFEPRNYNGLIRSHDHINDLRFEILQYGLDDKSLFQLATANLAVGEAFDAECWRIFMDAGDSIAGQFSQEPKVVAQTWENLLNSILSFANSRLRVLGASIWKVPLLQRHIVRPLNELNQNQQHMLEAVTRQRWQPLITGQELTPQTMQRATATLVSEQLAEEDILLLSRLS